MVFMGLNLPFYNTPAIVMIQEKVEPEYMGRVMSVLGMINGAAMPLGMLVFGPLADYIAIEWLMVISGLVMLLIGLSILMNRGLMRAGESRKTIETLKVEVVPTLSE
jgi:DHA3 family macrolide efflux protein-like MFS transporter